MSVVVGSVEKIMRAGSYKLGREVQHCSVRIMVYFAEYGRTLGFRVVTTPKYLVRR